MMLDKPVLAVGAVLVGSLRATGAFLGCCDEAPPPAPAYQEHTHPPPVTQDGQPSSPGTVVIEGAIGPRAGATITVPGENELNGRIEISGTGGTFVYIGQLVARPGKTLVAAGTSPRPTGTGGPVPAPAGDGGSLVAPKPRKLYRLWRSPEIETVVLSPSMIQAIEADGHPLRFAFSLPFATPAELLASDVDSIWVEAYDASGRSVAPAGARLVSSPAVVGEWPILSTFLWSAAGLPVLSLAFDLVNADGSMVTPTQLGCGLHPVSFRIGLASWDPQANWDFGWCAGLWRTETDLAHIGAGGQWLGWHAGSFEALAPVSAPPRILALTDPSGTPITSVSSGDTVHLVVLDGFAPSETEISVGGYSMPLLCFAPGANPGEVVYTLSVPPQVELGPGTLFFRNLGATMGSNPGMVQQVVAGFDYRFVTVD